MFGLLCKDRGAVQQRAPGAMADRLLSLAFINLFLFQQQSRACSDWPWEQLDSDNLGMRKQAENDAEATNQRQLQRRQGWR